MCDLLRETMNYMYYLEAEARKSEGRNYEVMRSYCEQCFQNILLITQETNPVHLQALTQLLQTLTTQRDILRQRCLNDPKQPAKKTKFDGKRETSAPSAVRTSSSAAVDNEKERRTLAIEDTVVKRGQLQFDDVAGLSEAKQTLKEAIIMPLQFPHLFQGSRKPWRRILLYGPPGTGKSRLAQAVASEITSTFYSVSSADLVSSWVGESEKLIKELFSHARSQEGRAVIFIDEIDSICRKRNSREEEHTRRIKTELLKQMEGAGSEDQQANIFLLCATNCPWELDSAFLRRFQKRIYIPLPDSDACMKLIEIHTRDSPLHLSAADWQKLRSRMRGYSGSDVATLVLGAMFEPIRDLQAATHWRHTEDGKIVACIETTPGAFKANMNDLPPEKVTPRDVNLKDILKAIETYRKTVSAEELEKFESFTQNYGICG